MMKILFLIAALVASGAFFVHDRYTRAVVIIAAIVVALKARPFDRGIGWLHPIG